MNLKSKISLNNKVNYLSDHNSIYITIDGNYNQSITIKRSVRMIIDKEAIEMRSDKVLDYLTTPGFDPSTLYQRLTEEIG